MIKLTFLRKSIEGYGEVFIWRGRTWLPQWSKIREYSEVRRGISGLCKLHCGMIFLQILQNQCPSFPPSCTCFVDPGEHIWPFRTKTCGIFQPHIANLGGEPPGPACLTVPRWVESYSRNVFPLGKLHGGDGTRLCDFSVTAVRRIYLPGVQITVKSVRLF